MPASSKEEDFVPRAKFVYRGRTMTYFLPHMRKVWFRINEELSSGKFQMQLEVRDARLPLTSRNPYFQMHNTIPKVIAYTKSDLTTEAKDGDVIRTLHSPTPVFFTSAKSDQSVRALHACLVEQARAYKLRTKAKIFHVMIMGYPNVGKTTLMMKLRWIGCQKRGSNDKIHENAGTTKSLATPLKINENPAILVYDTAGIATGAVKDNDVSYKLAAINAVKLTSGDIRDVADFILYHLNLHPKCRRKYVSSLGLPAPTNSLHVILRQINNERRLPVLQATKVFLKEFWSGDYGKIRLESMDSASLAKKIEDEKRHVLSQPIMNKTQRRKLRQRDPGAILQAHQEAYDTAHAKVQEITELEEAAELD